jgi:hypothetical protein
MFFTGIWNVTTSLVLLLPDSTDNNNINNTPDPKQGADSGDSASASGLSTRACALVSVLDRDYPEISPRRTRVYRTIYLVLAGVAVISLLEISCLSGDKT